MHTAAMARSSVNINHVNDINATKQSGKKRTSLPWRILALLAVLCCNASLPVAAATVASQHVDSSSVATVDAAFDAATVADDGGVAKRSAEDLQLPHVFRHQEHYSHRIEQVVNDLKRTQLHRQLSGNYSNTTARNIAGSEVNGDNSGTSNSDNNDNDNDNDNNNYKHFQSKLQPRFSEHLRHNHNQRHHSLAPVSAWERYLLPPLRHQRHQQERQQQNQQPEYVAAATMVVTSSPLIALVAPTATETANDGVVVVTNVTNEHANILPAIPHTVNGSSAQQQHIKTHRYFDRDGLYQTSSYIWTTRGPKVRLDANYWKTKEDFPNSHLSAGKQIDSQRISLNLNANSEDEPYTHEEGVEGERYKTNEAHGNIGEDNDSEMVNDDIDNSSDDYDDYSYEEDSTESAHSANEFANVNNMYDGVHRNAVKRYTNPFNDLRLPPKKRDYPPHPYMSLRRRTGTVPGGNAGNAGNVYANFGVDAGDDNSEADFSSEKWQRIEQEHHRKQQEHQHQMMALRARHDGKYRSTAAAATAMPLIMAATATQQRQNDDVSAVIN